MDLFRGAADALQSSLCASGPTVEIVEVLHWPATMVAVVAGVILGLVFARVAPLVCSVGLCCYGRDSHDRDRYPNTIGVLPGKTLDACLRTSPADLGFNSPSFLARLQLRGRLGQRKAPPLSTQEVICRGIADSLAASSAMEAVRQSDSGAPEVSVDLKQRGRVHSIPSSPPGIASSTETGSVPEAASPVSVAGLHMAKRVTLEGKHGFEFTEHAPETFLHIRQMYGISELSFMDSMASLQGSFARGEGKGGCLFLTTSDRRFIMKTVKEDEKDKLLRVLRDYVAHLSQHRATLLPWSVSPHDQLHPLCRCPVAVCDRLRR